MIIKPLSTPEQATSRAQFFAGMGTEADNAGHTSLAKWCRERQEHYLAVAESMRHPAPGEVQ